MASPARHSPCFSPKLHPTLTRGTHDTVFRTTDRILFTFNLQTVQLRVARPIFSSVITTAVSQDEILHFPETSEILDIVLHALHNSSCTCRAPSIEALGKALQRMPRYGISPGDYARPGTLLYKRILSHAPASPLASYTLAAQYRLHELAVECSPYMLNVPIADITEDAAERMGPIYAKNALLLHTKYHRQLRDIGGKPPDPHPPLLHCEAEKQRDLLRDWIATVGSLLMEVVPGMPSPPPRPGYFDKCLFRFLGVDLSGASQATRFMSLTEELDCEDCKDAVRERVATFCHDWARTKVICSASTWLSFTDMLLLSVQYLMLQGTAERVFHSRSCTSETENPLYPPLDGLSA